MNRKFFFIGLLMLSLTMFMGASLSLAATFDVNMGDMTPADCVTFGPSDIGFVDCTSFTGGILVSAMTSISTGDTVRWTMKSTPHTATSGPTGGPNVPCGTGDLFDSGVGKAFTPAFYFAHKI